MTRPEIVHEPENSRFIIPFDDEPATLKYSLHNEHSKDKSGPVVDFTSTYVPPQHRNTGVGEALVRRGLKWAKEQGYHIQASCWYVGKFLH